jgi:xanthine dehydrogenase molybdenum-binding subunit
MLHARVLRAHTPHAVLVGLDVSKAKELPGVIDVLTAADVPGQNSHGVVIHDWPVLVGIGEKVRYIGDALALVAAQSRAIATQALDLIKVEFEHLPVRRDLPKRMWCWKTFLRPK